MPLFTPPTTDGNPLAVRGQPGYALWRHFGSWAEGQTVWKDAQGNWHRQLSPYQGGETHTVHDGNTTTVRGPSTNVLHLANAQKVYHGGHVYPITDAEATELTAAGYGAFITTNALEVPGLTTARAYTTDRPTFRISTLDVRILLSMDPWAPVFLSAHLIGQAPQDGINNAWVYSIHPNQHPRTAVYDGVNIFGQEATEALTYPGGDDPHWLRSTSVLDNGSGQRVWDYYTSEDGETWTPLGTQIVESGAVTMFDSPSPLSIPGSNLGFIGKVFYAEVREGIDGTIVANPDFRVVVPGTKSFRDSAGNSWILTDGIDVVET